MSLFQCDKCGCRENTATSNASRAHFNNNLFEGCEDALASYRVILGLKPNEPFGAYCSACSPWWYGANGDLGIGPNPNPKPGEGLWHGRFERKFYPLGTMMTDSQGNLAPKPKHDVTSSAQKEK